MTSSCKNGNYRYGTMKQKAFKSLVLKKNCIYSNPNTTTSEIGIHHKATCHSNLTMFHCVNLTNKMVQLIQAQKMCQFFKYHFVLIKVISILLGKSIRSDLNGIVISEHWFRLWLRVIKVTRQIRTPVLRIPPAVTSQAKMKNWLHECQKWVSHMIGQYAHI